jgi:hypothetical protein
VEVRAIRVKWRGEVEKRGGEEEMTGRGEEERRRRRGEEKRRGGDDVERREDVELTSFLCCFPYFVLRLCSGGAAGGWP